MPLPTEVKVFDAGPLIDYLSGLSRGLPVHSALSDPDVECHAHALNLAEVFYHFSRISDVLHAREALETLARDGLIRHDDLDAAFLEDLAQWKADWKRVSLADCCGLALTRRLNGTFVTTDTHELVPLQAAGVLKIEILL